MCDIQQAFLTDFFFIEIQQKSRKIILGQFLPGRMKIY